MSGKWLRFWLRHPFRYCYRHRTRKEEYHSWAGDERWCNACMKDDAERSARADAREAAQAREAAR